MSRVTLDSNIYLSALVFGGSTARAAEAINIIFAFTTHVIPCIIRAGPSLRRSIECQPVG